MSRLAFDSSAFRQVRNQTGSMPVMYGKAACRLSGKTVPLFLDALTTQRHRVVGRGEQVLTIYRG
jgi:hypothetical protein